MQDNQETQTKKTKTGRRRRIPLAVRTTLLGLAVAMTALWALTVSYEIPREELWRFFTGTLLLIAGIVVLAVGVVVLVKLPGVIIRRLRNRR